MGIISEISSAIKDAKGLMGEVKKINDFKVNDSLARRSSQATLQFPILVTDSIDINRSQAVSKAIEKKYATFVQLVISMNPYLDLKKDKNIVGYLNNIHQNAPTITNLLKENAMELLSDENISVFLSLNEGCSGEVLHSNRKQMYSITESLNSYRVNDLYKPKSITMGEAEAKTRYFLKENSILVEAKQINADNPSEYDKHTNKNRVNMKPVDGRKPDKSEDPIDQNRVKSLGNDAERSMKISQWEAEQRSRASVKMSDNDVKKANELVPTTLSVTINPIQGDNFGGALNFVLGVKGIMHLIPSNEMISNLLSGLKSGNKFFNFVRWTTGEIKFVKDLLLNIDQLKDDAVKKYTGGSAWWTTLKRRKTLAKAKNLMSRTKLLPNATIVCSIEEVIEMKEVYGFDLMNLRHATKLMNDYFLLGFVVVDSSQELVHFLFDGESSFETLSFNGLEKENNSKNDFKEIYKMISSGRL